jgi:hypothetical protein
MPFRADRVTGSSAGPAGEAVDAFGKVSGGFYRLVDDYAFGRIDRPHPGSTMELLKTGVDLYELSPTRIQRNKRLMLPGTSLGRLHAKTAVIDRSTVFIGSMNLDPRSASKNTELGIIRSARNWRRKSYGSSISASCRARTDCGSGKTVKALNG